MKERIVVALDGSARSELSLPWIPLLWPGAQVTLLRVVEPAYGLEAYGDAIVRELWGEAHKYLSKLSKRIKPTPDAVVEMGSASNWILKVARRKKTDFIVLTTHGGSPILRNTVGGTTERLLHSSNVPLLVVPSSVSVPPPSHIEKIMVPLDGSEPSERILPVAAKMAQNLGAELLMTHVLVESDVTTVANTAGTSNPDFMKQYRQLIVHQWEEIEIRMREKAKQIEKKGIRARMFLDSGGVPDAILRRTRDEGAEMIAMSAHGYGVFGRMLLGSVASRLIRSTPVPVLVAKYKALAGQGSIPRRSGILAPQS